MANNVVQVYITAITKGFNKAVREVSRDISKLKDHTSGLTKGFTSANASIAKSAVGLGLMGAAAGSAMSGVAGLGSAVATLVPALALMPAVAGVGAAAMATLTVGMKGFGEALANMGDPEKFNEALKSLSPNAQAAAKAVQGLSAPFKELQQVVQDNLFAGIGEQISAIGTTYLPVLKEGMSGVATSLNGMAMNFASFLKNAQTVKDTATLFGNTKLSIDAMTPAVGNLSAAFRDIGVVASGFLPGLAGGFTNATEKFAAFIGQARESGALSDWIQGAIKGLGDLFGTLKNLGSILGSVFGGMQDSGVNLLSVIRDVTGNVATFLKTTEGATMLNQIFTGLQGLIKGLSPILEALGTAFQTTLAPLIEKLGPQLGQVLSSLAPAIQPLADALAQVAPILVQVAGIVVGELANGIGVLAPLLPLVANAFLSLVKAVQPLLPILFDLIGQLLPPLTSLIQAMMPVVDLVVQNLGRMLQAIIPVVAELATSLIPIIEKLLPVAETIFTTLAKVVEAAMNIISGIIKVVSGIIEGDWSKVWEGIKQIFSGVWDGIKAIVSGAFNAVWELIKAVLGGIVSSIGEGLGKAVDWFKGLGGRILDAIGNLGSTLLGIGKDLLSGLWNGIQNGAGWLKDKISGFFGSLVPDWVKDALGIASPSKVFMKLGKYVTQGLALGLQETAGVQKAAQGLAAAVERGFRAPELAISAKGDSMAYGSNSNTGNTYNITVQTLVADANTGKVVVDAIKEYEKIGGRR